MYMEMVVIENNPYNRGHLYVSFLMQKCNIGKYGISGGSKKLDFRILPPGLVFGGVILGKIFENPPG